MARSLVDGLFASPLPLFTAALLLRAVLLVYGLWQDAHSPLKYTDVDYLVFTDAARFTFGPPASSGLGSSPYARETYRYTPLLAWLLYPTTRPAAGGGGGGGGGFSAAAWFSAGKLLFAAADLAAGALVVRVLRRHRGMSAPRARRFAAIWLLNPMVAAISTRGSSEGLLGVLVMALLWAVLERRVRLAGALLGLAVHFKIYPFVYGPAIVWWMDRERMAEEGEAGGAPGSTTTTSSSSPPLPPPPSFFSKAIHFLTPERLRLAIYSLFTFVGLNALMYQLYGADFVQHTFLHHVTRIDHRHNFSPYNVLLYLTSAQQQQQQQLYHHHHQPGLRLESLAFVPQMLLSTVLIPLVGAKKDLPATMLAQTFAFVTFNKVCTSQYFLWYMVLLPLSLPRSSLLRRPTLGAAALAAWVGAQALWLQQAYDLEFLGRSTFVPGLWLSSLAFFLVNCAILGVVIEDLDDGGGGGTETTTAR